MRIFILLITIFGYILAKDTICVSILPQKFFVKKIVGNNFNVEVMVKPGSSPENYSVKPNQLLQIKKAKIYFSIGVPFEKAWLKRFKSVNSNLKIVDMGRYVKRYPMQNEGENLDPHIWLSPPLVMLEARVVLEEAIKLDKKNSDIYIKNYQNFINELAALDSKIIKMMQNLKKRKFIVFHPSFGYFARSYGLKQIAIEREGKEPSAAYLKRVINIAKQNKIRVIFTEPQFPKRSAEFIAQVTNAKIEVIDPLAYNWDKNILEVAKAIEKANSN